MAIAAGILLFGDHSLGWRVPALVAGIALLACVYPLGRRLGLSPPWALLGLLFAAADPLGIAQSRIATLDIFIAVWTVACILFALRYVQDGWRPRWLFVSGLAGGMAAATKWSGGLAIIAALLIIAVSWLLQRRAARKAEEAGLAADQPGRVALPTRVPLTPPLSEQMPVTAPQGSGVAAHRTHRRRHGPGPGRRLLPQLRAVLHQRAHVVRLRGAAPAGRVLQPPPARHAHLRVHRAQLDHRPAPGLVLLRGQDEVLRRDRHRQPVPLVDGHAHAPHRASCWRSCAGRSRCCPSWRSSSCCTCRGSPRRGPRSSTT